MIVLPTEPFSFFLGEHCALKSVTVGGVFYDRPVH